MVENSVRPNIPKDGIFGGRKWSNIPAEDYSTIICPYSVIVGIFRHLSEYSGICQNILTIVLVKYLFFRILKQKLLVQMCLQVN